MNSTMLYTLVAIMAVAGIFWLVVYSSKRGQEHREKRVSSRRSLMGQAVQDDSSDLISL